MVFGSFCPMLFIYHHQTISAWWFGKFLFSHISGMSIPTIPNSIIFQRGRSTTNQNSVFQMDGLDLNSFEVTEVLTSCGPLSRLPLYVTSAIIRGRFGDLISERFNGLVEEKFTSTRGFYHQNLGLLPLKFAS